MSYANAELTILAVCFQQLPLCQIKKHFPVAFFGNIFFWEVNSGPFSFGAATIHSWESGGRILYE